MSNASSTARNRTMPTEPLSSPGPPNKPHNRKMGRAVWNFSILAGITCPGETEACKDLCYAKGFLFQLRSEILAYLTDWTRRPGFMADVATQVRRHQIGMVRVHVAGDFYSVAYAKVWIRIFRLCPGTRFWFYTRSWRKRDGSTNAAMVGVMAAAATLPNVQVWFSEDRDSGRAPRVPGVRVAFTQFAATDIVPPHADLVFRDRRVVKNAAPTKRINGVQVCPHEDGIVRKCGPITCSMCQICTRPARRRSA